MNALVDHRRLDAVLATAMAFSLETEGYSIARNAVPRALVDRIDQDLEEDFRQTPFCSGDFYGARTKRFGRLLARSPRVADLVMAPLILSLVERILGPWCDAIQLNVAQAIEIHPGALAQFPHRDQDMWPDAAGSHEYCVNVLWPLSAFTPDNGATLIWPDSHGRRALDPTIDTPPVAAVSEPSDAIVFLGSTLHGAGANRTADVRRGIVIGYSLGWLKPYENPWLSYPPAIARGFAPDLAALAGYRQHRPNLGNFEGQCPSVLLGGAIEERLAATDALTPHQAAALADYVANQARAEDAVPVLAACPS